MSGQKSATRIKEFRIAAGMTATQLGEKVGISQPGISRIENGRVGATLDKLNKIADVLNVDVTDLIVAKHKARYTISFEDGAVAVSATLVDPEDVEKLIIQLNTVRDVMERNTSALCSNVVPMTKRDIA